MKADKRGKRSGICMSVVKCFLDFPYPNKKKTIAASRKTMKSMEIKQDYKSKRTVSSN
jgi:hypothetical protein